MPDALDPDTREHLERLTRGLLVTRGDSQEGQPHLFLGTLPDHLPIELPLPEQTQILGALVYSTTAFEILLESALHRVELLTFFRTQLAARDWQEPDIPPPYQLGGFTPEGFTPIPPDTSLHYVTFFQEASGTQLSVGLSPLESGPTVVRLDLSVDPDQHWRAYQRLRPRDPKQSRQRIPYLLPPPGAHQRPRAGTISDRDISSTADLTTTLGLEDVAAHYAERLRQGGWRELEQGSSGPVAWQRWQFTSGEREPWTGLFFAVHTPGEGCDYILTVRGLRTASLPTA